ncbi:methyltransferase family protein [Krasilnikovia cinnamomea]|uniref:Methyltransferase family protein n=1 Tax=Krasilnikovia cinnamomea TaxID=349313 RepID=A0A4Q7ZI52_9ACTN|nr:class I SAM-dependent methyltransferase [Krasilnikovia cinnamomea]RZU50124.1 methyltransferase family protein [Krasilnikovia cinnamomea]
MSTLFGEVAALYDDIRPGYPGELLDTVRAYHGGTPHAVVDIGAGTGQGTELLLRLGAPVTCVEPDTRMAAVLAAKFPQVQVEAVRFEDWAPPPGGADMLACASAWHWMDPPTRARRAHDALAPGGTLAVFHNRFEYAAPAASHAIDEVYQAVDGPEAVPRRSAGFAYDDIVGSGLFADARAVEWHRYPELTTQGYLRLTETFAPFRQRPERERQTILAGLAAAIDGLGGRITMDIRTVLAIGHRPR